MPIIAVCPFCQEGKVRAPDNALGQSATCPRCLNCFTIVSAQALPAAADVVKPSLAAPAIAVGTAGTTATLSAPRVAAADPPETPLETTPIPAVAPAHWLPTYHPGPPEHTKTAFILALSAFTLAGIALGVSQVPYGRAGTVVLSGVGLILGVGSLVMAAGPRLWPAAATLANGMALLVVVAAPSWLGLATWWPERVEDTSAVTRLVPRDGSAAKVQNEWVDVSGGAWQQGDVRITVDNVVVGSVELQGPKKKNKAPKEKVLMIALRIANVGAARVFNYQSWNESFPPETAPVLLQDLGGKVIRLKTFEAGWDVAGKSKGAALMPGKVADDVLIFEAPPATVDGLRLELPAAAFGNPGTVRLHIPRTMVAFR